MFLPQNFALLRRFKLYLSPSPITVKIDYYLYKPNLLKTPFYATLPKIK